MPVRVRVCISRLPRGIIFLMNAKCRVIYRVVSLANGRHARVELDCDEQRGNDNYTTGVYT